VNPSTVINSTTISLLRADITTQETEAIVNAANSSLMGGGGVDGAIHRAGGPLILEECKAVRARQGPLPPGEAVLTSGGRLKARYVLHTVGPVWQGGSANEDALLADCYRSCLQLAVAKGIHSIAFPSISTGAYGFPAGRAATIAFSTVAEFVRSTGALDEVRFVVFSESDMEIYRSLFAPNAGEASREDH
jgi:O-acetyl-ADP-ribose deacetylase (regulator of RNase III)